MGKYIYIFLRIYEDYPKKFFLLSTSSQVINTEEKVMWIAREKKSSLASQGLWILLLITHQVFAECKHLTSSLPAQNQINCTLKLHLYEMNETLEFTPFPSFMSMYYELSWEIS